MAIATIKPSAVYLTDYPTDGRWEHRELMQGELGLVKAEVRKVAILAAQVAADELGIRQPSLIFMTEARMDWITPVDLMGRSIYGLEYKKFGYQDWGLRGFYFPFSKSNRFMVARVKLAVVCGNSSIGNL